MRSRLRPDDERGATLVIVVLSLIAMMGMIVLVVDVGGVLWKRRELINGADAAALAAAKSCADSADTAVASDIALQYANDNVTDSGSVPLGGGVVDVENCDAGPGFITVQYTQDKKLFFAPVLGFGDEGEVAGKATAAWGPIGGGDAVPIVINAGPRQGPCDAPDGAEKGDLCPLWYDSSSLGDADWGFLNLSDRGWGVDADANCSSPGANERKDWILNNYTGGARVLNGDPPGKDPTYVCVDTGHCDACWQTLIERMDKDPYLLFPVNNCDGQVDKNGNPAPCPATPDKYDIVGFIRLKLVQVLEGNDAAAIGTKPVAGDSGDCGNGAALGTSGIGEGGVGGWNLAVFADTYCGAPTTADTITNVRVVPPKKNDPPIVACSSPGLPAGCDYFYNTSTKVLTWWDLTSKNVDNKVNFSWTTPGTPGTPGVCGIRSSDPNAICIEMEYQGFTTSGGFVLGGQDFGTYGYVLCDRDLETCPDQQS